MRPCQPNAINFVDCTHLTLAAQAGRIRDDGTVILIDMSGYTTGSRLLPLCGRVGRRAGRHGQPLAAGPVANLDCPAMPLQQQSAVGVVQALACSHSWGLVQGRLRE